MNNSAVKKKMSMKKFCTDISELLTRLTILFMVYNYLNILFIKKQEWQLKIILMLVGHMSLYGYF